MATRLKDESQIIIVMDLGLIPEPIVIGKGAEFLLTNYDFEEITDIETYTPTQIP